MERFLFFTEQRAHVVGQQGLKPSVFKAQFIMTTQQLGLPIRA